MFVAKVETENINWYIKYFGQKYYFTIIIIIIIMLFVSLKLKG